MPEGPELHLASLFVNRICEGVVFTGPVEKSEVSKSPEVPFCCDAYRIKAQSRGKEIRLTLTPIKTDDDHRKSNINKNKSQQPMDVVFRFGMSGSFRFTALDELPKHSHLRFCTNETPHKVLSFVDPRRFGGWQPNGNWQADRGPCIMFEYESFRENVHSNLSDKAFDRPICEALLNQKYFNGVGNYLRAEILYRTRIPPFENARTVLQGLELKDEDKKKVKAEIPVTETADRIKIETPDLLSLCHTVPLEVVKLGGKGYDPQTSNYSIIIGWMQCYGVDGMKSIRDRNGRTMWFTGDPGPMVPKDFKSPKGGKRKVQKRDHDYTDPKKAKKKRTGDVANKMPVKQKQIKNIKKETKTSRSERGSKRQKIDEKTIDAEETKRPITRRSGTAGKGTKGQNKKQEVASKTKNKSAICRKSTTKEKAKRKSSRGHNT